MKTFSIQHPTIGEIRYQDRKRWLWMGSLLLPLVPVFVIILYGWLMTPWILLSPLILGYVVFPIVDHFVGTDQNNPPEEIVPQLDADSYYRWLTFFAVPLHYITLVLAVWFVAVENLALGFELGFAIVAGIYSGLAINTAHELGHKQSRLESRLARIALALTGYGHFCVEHNGGHHRDVATPEDPASSRMGESIYRFALREIPGAMQRGWQVEKDRLNKRGNSTWIWRNRILQSYALTIVLQGSLLFVFGMQILLFLIVHNVIAWFQLTSANYIEHYGLLRAKLENGRYERCQPIHSWNTNHLFSNLMLFHLQRHSDHHANPGRRYQSLRAFDDLPELPSGYFGMYLLAYFPPLWYRVMDQLLLKVPHIDGDLDRINLDPKSEKELKCRYAA